MNTESTTPETRSFWQGISAAQCEEIKRKWSSVPYLLMPPLPAEDDAQDKKVAEDKGEHDDYVEYDHTSFVKALQIACELTDDCAQLLSNLDLLWMPDDTSKQCGALNYFQFAGCAASDQRDPVATVLHCVFLERDCHWDENDDLELDEDERETLRENRMLILNKYKSAQDFLNVVRVTLWHWLSADDFFIMYGFSTYSRTPLQSVWDAKGDLSAINARLSDEKAEVVVPTSANTNSKKKRKQSNKDNATAGTTKKQKIVSK